uniref:Secreted protein n=1 Tax=Ascaris lumbricoides TaxID=6252 RepID=A0A0M3I301_ASCLU
MPKTGIEPVSPLPQRGVLTTILLGPLVFLVQENRVKNSLLSATNLFYAANCAVPWVPYPKNKSLRCLTGFLSLMPKTGIEPVSPRPQRGVLNTILLGSFVPFV